MRKDLKLIYDANLRDFGHLPEEKIMALTLWAETRGEPIAGKVAVGTVIMNRVEHRSWDGKTVKEVCLWPKQFSCFNPNDVQRAQLVAYALRAAMFSFEESPVLNDCLIISTELLEGIIRPDRDILQSKCCQYLTVDAKAHCNWWKKMRFVKKIGGHEFFTDLN